MWPFSRKPKSFDGAPAMPPELNNYYQAEKRQQTAVTWLLGFATLAITIAIAFGLFLSARWIVQKVRNNPDKGPETTQQQGEDNDKDDETAAAPAQPAKPAQPASEPAGRVDAGGSNTAPKTTASSTTLPSTGPTETLAVFMVATLAGTFAYRLTTKRQ